MHQVWLGTHASYMAYHAYFEKFQFDKEAFSPFTFDEPQTGVDAVFGVSEDRKGLYLMEKVGETTVIKLHGSLVEKFSRWQKWFPGETTSYEAVKDALKIAQESGNKKVLLDIASPGGAVNGLATVTTLIGKLRKTGMKIDAHTDSNMMSAAYWIAASARQITASEQSEQGSIGTMAVVRTYANTEENMGVKFTVIKAGKFKAIGNPYEELTKEQLDYLQDNIDESNKFFLNHVSKYRGLSLDATDQWAEGQTFFANQALKVGLIDKISTLDDLIGSGSTATNTHPSGRIGMKISQEKLDKIASGVDPKAVLTDAEFKHWTETNAAANAGEGEEGGGEDGDKPGGEKPPKGEGDEEPDPETTANAAGLQKLYSAQLKENGKLEGKLENAVETITKLQEQIKALQETSDNLVVVAQGAITKMQMALGKPQAAQATPAGLLAQHNELHAEMARRFPTSQQSKEAATEDNTKQAVGNFRLKPATSR